MRSTAAAEAEDGEGGGGGGDGGYDAAVIIRDHGNGTVGIEWIGVPAGTGDGAAPGTPNACPDRSFTYYVFPSLR